MASLAYATFKTNLSLAQADISGLTTGSSPTFANITDSALTASVPVVTDGSKVLVSQSYANFKTSLSLAQADISGLTTASSPTFAGETLTGDFIAHSLVTDATQWNPKFIIKEGTNGSLMSGWDTGWFPHTAYYLNTTTNQNKTAIYIQSMNYVVSAPSEASTGIMIDHYTNQSSNNEWSGICSVEWGGGNAGTFQIRDDYGASYFPAGAPAPTVDRYHGFALEVDLAGNRTGLHILPFAGARTGSVANGLSMAIGVGNADGGEGVRIYPSIDATNMADRTAIHVASSASDLSGTGYNFKVRMDGMVFMPNNIGIWMKNNSSVESEALRALVSGNTLVVGGDLLTYPLLALE